MKSLDFSDQNWASKRFILITGKGGVGKSTLAKAVAKNLARSPTNPKKKVLLCRLLQLSDDPQQIRRIEPDYHLDELVLNSWDCFREYIILKLRVKALYSILLSNKIIRYLEKAAPGVREIVLLGKIWFEKNNYDHVVVDMPSTGYALTLFNTPFNFLNLFPGGPIYRDCQDMISTFSDPNYTSLVIVTLAEEMPVQESLELAGKLKEFFPGNEAKIVVNRLISFSSKAKQALSELSLKSPTSDSELFLKNILHYLETKHHYQQNQQKTLEENPFGENAFRISEGQDELLS